MDGPEAQVLERLKDQGRLVEEAFRGEMSVLLEVDPPLRQLATGRGAILAARS